MAHTVEISPLLNNEDAIKTLSKLYTSFIFIPFMSMNNVLKVVVTNKNMAEVYINNGNVYFFQEHPKFHDRLKQVDYKRM